MTQQELEQETKLIEHGKRMKEFVEDPAVREVFSTLEKRYFAQWGESQEPADREMLWAQGKALRDLAIELRAGVEKGKFATSQRATRQAAEERQREREARTGRVR